MAELPRPRTRRILTAHLLAGICLLARSADRISGLRFPMRVLRDLGRSVCGDMHARVERGHSGAQVKSEVAEGTAKGYKPIPADAHEHWCAACVKVKARSSAA